MVSSGQSTRATLVAITILIIVEIMRIGISPVQAQECPGLDVGTLRSKCLRYVIKLGPKTRSSAGCCGVVRNINVPCACKFVNKDVEKVLSVNKVVYVAQFCGLALPHGIKCGSHTIP